MICRRGEHVGSFSRAGRRREQCAGRRTRGNASRRRAAARTERPRLRRAHQDCARRGRSPLWRCRSRRRDPRRSAGDVRADRSSHIRSGTASRSRRHVAQARPGEPRARRRRLRAAIAIASGQGTRSFELRAALSLARLYQSTGRPVEAHAVLAPALEGFSPTPEMPEIAEAQALLAALAETDEVKAEATRRQRLTQLHVAYGNALIAARGFGAPETTEAFARARESASATRTRPSDWRPTTVFGPATSCAASCHRCGRTQRPSSATSRRDPIRPRPASLTAPPG